jgi:DNA-directed RNA polymerase specialized sigma24 family protein
MTAEEFFEQARQARADMERIARSREADTCVSSTRSDADGKAAHVSLMDREAVEDAVMSDCAATIAAAREVLFGVDGAHGLRKALPGDYAYVLDMRYCQNMAWGEVARTLGISETTCHEKKRVAFDYVDSAGFAESREGGSL